MRAASRRFVVMCCCVVYLVTLSVVSLTQPKTVTQTNAQTVTVEQSDTLGDLIKREMERDGMRIGMGRVSTRNRRPDSE